MCGKVQGAPARSPKGHWITFASHSISSDTAADGHHGWASAAALKRCAATWEDHMVDLGKQMNTMADNLHTTANAYDTTDAQAKDAFGRLQHGLADFGRN